jgi:CheY-like chemotaxis protein
MPELPRRILLVEDSVNDIELTLEALSDYDIAANTDVVRDGAEALDYLLREGAFADRPSGNPLVVLLDLKLPKIDGVEVLRRIRAHEQLRTMPVVVLTSSRENQDLLECYKLGVNAYVVKPVTFDEFIGAVKSVGLFWALTNEPPPEGLNK